MKQKLFYLLLLPLACWMFAACSGDDDEEKADTDIVVIGEDGKASNGKKFEAIDDNHFYLDYILYTIEEGHLAVTDFHKTGFKGHADIVDVIKYKGQLLTVTVIRGSAFSKCANLTEVTIPNTVTDIGLFAFYDCPGLVKIYCSWTNPPFNVLTLFSSDTFKNCTLYIPKGTKEAYKATMPWSKFKNIVEEGEPDDNSGDSGSDSGDSGDHPDDETVVIGEDGTASNGMTFEAINDNNFYLARVKYTIENGHLAVTGHSENIYGDVIIVNGITYKGKSYKVLEVKGDKNRDNAAFYGCDEIYSVTIPNSVKTIGDYAFACCEELSSLTLGNSVESIGANAFWLCKGTSELTLPKSVESMGDNPFGGWVYLNSIKVEQGNTRYDSRNNCNAIIDSKTNSLVTGCQNTTIPNSVTSIGQYAFTICENLTSLTIPNSVTSIGQYAFSNCKNLASLTIPNSVKSIGDNAFYYCTSLKSITLLNSLTSIGNYLFYYCRSLNSLTIPNSVTSIGEMAFKMCYALTSLTIPSSVKSIGDWAFSDSGLKDIYCRWTTPPTCNEIFSDKHYSSYMNGQYTGSYLHIPKGTLDAYNSTSPWKKFEKKMEE